MISVIMGIYNCENTLEEAVDSIINQTYTNWELIMCDDGSTDNTYKIAKKLEQQDKRIKVIKNKQNLGLAATLNICLKYTKGKYIARMDADDISTPDRLKMQVDFLDKNKEFDLVGGLMQSFDEFGDKNIIGIKQLPNKYDLPKFNPFHHATIMMKSECMKLLNGYTVSKDTTRAEDVDLWFRFFNLNFNGYNLQHVIYKVREDKNAYRRRKLKYAFQASKVLYKGIKLLKLPLKYYLYTIKPILSWFTPLTVKQIYRKKLVGSKC